MRVKLFALVLERAALLRILAEDDERSSDPLTLLAEEVAEHAQARQTSR